MIETIERIVVEHYNENRIDKMTIELLHERRRFRHIVFLRQIVFYLYSNRYNQANDTLEVIGSFYGLDHATVLHAKKTVENLIDVDKKISRDMAELIKRIDKVANGPAITIHDRKKAERNAWHRLAIRLMKKRKPPQLTSEEVYNEYNFVL